MPSLLELLGGTPTTAAPTGGLLGTLASGGKAAPSPVFGGGSRAPVGSPALPTPGGGVFGGATGAPAVPKSTDSGGHGGLSGLLPELFHLTASLPQATFNLFKSSAAGQGQQIHDLLHGDIKGALNPYTNPATKQVAEGFPQTGGRLVDFLASTAPGGEKPSESQYGKAYSSGHLVGALAQDLGNISLVGSIAGKPLGAAADAAEASAEAAQTAAEQAAKEAAEHATAEQAARAEAHGSPSPILNARVLQASTTAAESASRAQALADAATQAAEHGEALRNWADRAEAVSKLTGKAANAPFAPIGLAGKAVGAGVEAASGLGEAGAAAGGLADRAAHPVQALGDLARGVQAVGERSQRTTLARNLIRSGKFEGDRLLGPIRSANEARAGVLADPIEEGAHSVLMGGEAQATAGPYEKLHAYGQPEAAAQYVQNVAARLGVEPAALQHAYESLDPTNTTPEMEASRGRMAEAENIYRTRALPVLEGEHLAGRDVPGGIANAEQLAKAQHDIGSTPYGDTPEERLDPANAPARYRPMLQAGRAASDTLDQMAAEAEKTAPGSGFGFTQIKQDAITSLQQATDEGIDPAHVIGGNVDQGGGSRPAVELPPSRDSGATKRKIGASQPRTVHDQQVLMARRAHTIAQAGAARLIQEQMGRTAADVLGAEAEGLTGRDLAQAMRAKGYKAWDPTNALSRDPVIRDAHVAADTRFIPSTVMGEFRRHFNEYNPANISSPLLRGIVKTSDLGNKAFRVGVLNLSPRWILGHTIGHTVLDLAAGISPVELGHYLNQSRHLAGGDVEGAALSEAERSLLGPNGERPESLLRRGQIGGTPKEAFTPGGPPERGLLGTVGHGLAHPIESSRAVVSASDDINRVAIALAKADKGLSNAEAAAFAKAHPDLAHLPRQQLTNEWAIRESLRVAGDMSNLTGVERDVISRAVLFYPWVKHITKLTFDLAVHDPARVAWTLYLANMFGPHDEQFPITQGKWDLGHDWFASLPKLNPFDAPFGYFGATGAGSTPLASLNPLASLGARLAGFDTSKLEGVSQPAGFGPTNAYGSGQALGLNPAAFTQGLLQDQPQLAAASTAIPALFGHQPVVRYDTGQPVRIAHQDIATDPLFGGNVAGPFLNLLGAGASKIDVKAIAAREAELRKQAAAARASYGRVLPGRAP